MVTFEGSGLLIAICDLLFDFARAFFPSRFPRVQHIDQDIIDGLRVTLTGLSGVRQDVQNQIGTITTVLRGPAPGSQESILKILLDVKTELQATTAAIREQTQVIRDLKTDLATGRESTDPKFDQMIVALTKMQEALSNLLE
ncbi:hypothetical protein B0T21DRAFT_348796 [Apiosordaria backusii]|uniref:Uncharacterized protein n=1 Tax=Apiosordaria backusii TaxID=314023 RepID=A0AA40BM48_9PEZI|nr:hypothetical protein B0T21DRAFT_348796 [Apiosordaria backusii]